MNFKNIKLANVLIIVVLIVLAIVAWKLFFGSKLREERTGPDSDGNYTIRYFDRNNKLVKTVYFDKNDNARRTVHSFSGKSIQENNSKN